MGCGWGQHGGNGVGMGTMTLRMLLIWGRGMRMGQNKLPCNSLILMDYVKNR